MKRRSDGATKRRRVRQAFACAIAGGLLSLCGGCSWDPGPEWAEAWGEWTQNLRDGAADPIYGRECARQMMRDWAEPATDKSDVDKWGEPYVAVEAEYNKIQVRNPQWTTLRPATLDEMLWRQADHAAVVESLPESLSDADVAGGSQEGFLGVLWSRFRVVWYFDENDQLRAVESHVQLGNMEGQPWSVIALWEDPSRYPEAQPFSRWGGAPRVADLIGEDSRESEHAEWYQ